MPQERIEDVVRESLPTLRAARALAARPGYRLDRGRLTMEPAVVVLAGTETAREKIPERLGGYRTDVRGASATETLRAKDPEGYAQAAARVPPEHRLARFPGEVDVATGKPVAAPLPANPTVPYTPPPGVPLAPVTDRMSLTCSASPDAGWAVLAAFLAAVKQGLTVGMYDFTSAHVLAAVRAALGSAGTLSLVLDDPPRNPTADQTDEESEQALARALGSRQSFAWAAEALDPRVSKAIFPSAYHIKVAVRDRAAFWLSSGNWNNSNQPVVDPWKDPTGAAAIAAKSDRDWHVVVEHPGLSRTLESYLRHDLAVAEGLQATAARAASPLPQALLAGGASLAPRPSPRRFFHPLTVSSEVASVQPLLTPDLGSGNYASNLLALLESAKQKLYIQTQYVHPPQGGEDAPFRALVDAVRQKMQAGLDVRVILSEYETAPYLEQLQAAGWNLAQVRIQRGVHNKGFVVDSSAVAVGSQNWSGDGVLRNRDATLVIRHAGVAQYFEGIFLADWEELAAPAA
ncbi:MAG TPA: phospholipase D-like domain-containing protein [Anaeromyxobacteraceae bacterium]|nr:phospholipase D-like domain-containing protein [Anaeromyxobacteraceae bacterium]